MPPVDKPKNDPLMLLLDEIEILSAQTRLMELYLKRAHSAAFGEVEKIQEQFRAKVTDLQASLEGPDYSSSQRLSALPAGVSQLDSENQELLRRLKEQQDRLRGCEEELAQRGAEIVALRQQLTFLEAEERESADSAALRIDQTQRELQSIIAQLQFELAQTDQALEQRDAAARQLEQSAQDRIRSLAEELAHSRESAEEQRTEFLRAEGERHALRQRVAELESAMGPQQAQTQRDADAFRQNAQAKIAALQSEVAHKTELLTRNQSTIATLERDLKERTAAAASEGAGKQAELNALSAEIARRDTELSTLSGRIAELEGLAAQRRQAAENEVSQARNSFAAELAALRAELEEKQRLLEQGQSNLQHTEQELRNRNRELQGKLAAKDSVVESQEHNLRHAQAGLLAARDALAEKERMLAEWQARAAEQEQRFLAQRDAWQCQSTEQQQLAETYRKDLDRVNGELATEFEHQRRVSAERDALREDNQRLAAEIDALASKLNAIQANLDSRSDALGDAEARLAESSAALGSARQALDEQQAKARLAEQEFAAISAELRTQLEQTDRALREHGAAANRTELALKAQIDDLENRLHEKERLLEARALEISVLQARVESLSGQTARLEAAHGQALADAASETARARHALQAEIAGWQSASEQQQALLDQRQAALNAIEKELRGEIELLKEQSSRQQAQLEEQTAELRRAETEASALRQRSAYLEATSDPPSEAPAPLSQSDANRIAALEQQLRSREQALADLENTLQLMEQQRQIPADEAALTPAEQQGGAAEQSEQLRAAQQRIDELLERLAQLETARHTLQENAAHELQQLRDSFESRIAKLRMELAAKDQAPAKEQSLEDQRGTLLRMEEDFQRQIQELQGQLAEKHGLLENRNEELIKVKTEMDSLQEHLARLKTRRAQETVDARFSVELREEDAVEVPRDHANGSHPHITLRPDPFQLSEVAPQTSISAGGDGDVSSAHRTNRFTHLEGRVRSWNPEPDKDSASNSARRWNMGIFKRRWKA